MPKDSIEIGFQNVLTQLQLQVRNIWRETDQYTISNKYGRSTSYLYGYA